ncbi:MAG TPA: hypothetical protein VM434_17030 [Beijerinckiaceae bacterium]|nr:hypothetical protein [Beijerinckiaceae bacterium]
MDERRQPLTDARPPQGRPKPFASYLGRLGLPVLAACVLTVVLILLYFRW